MRMAVINHGVEREGERVTFLHQSPFAAIVETYFIRLGQEHLPYLPPSKGGQAKGVRAKGGQALKIESFSSFFKRLTFSLSSDTC